jgi:Tol biopolymer transport system component
VDECYYGGPTNCDAGANVESGQVSPDGHWIAYRSDESGRNGIYVSPFPSPTGKLQVSVVGASRHDGKAMVKNLLSWS